MLNTELDTLAHCLLGGLRPRRDHNSVNTARDRTEVVIAPIALDLVRIGIDGKHLISPLAQTLVHDVAAMVLRLAGYAGYGYPLAGQELRCRLFDLHHWPPFVTVRVTQPRHH